MGMVDYENILLKTFLVIMTDTASNQRAIPTRQNMLDAMRWLVSDAQPNVSYMSWDLLPNANYLGCIIFSL